MIHLFFTVFLFSQAARSRPLSEASIYIRCHSQFVRRRPSQHDPIISQIKDRKTSAVEACMRLLNEANFSAQGRVASSSNPDSRPYEVLRTFQAFHASWFPNKDLIRQETETSTPELYDANEMSYHLTYNLFARGTRYSEVVTRPTSFRAVRVSAQPAKYLLDPEGTGGYTLKDAHPWKLGEDPKENVKWTPKLIDFGKLVGIVPMKKNENRVEWKDHGGELLRFDSSDSRGGGVIGTPPYILLNSTQQQGWPSGGKLRNARSWSKSVFSDLFCRELPVLREEDARPFVEEDSTVPFRKHVACMQCHSTMDPMASTIRNVMDIRSGTAEIAFFSPRLLAVYPTDHPQAASDLKDDLDFHRRPPDGSLYFRNYQGRLIDRAVRGVGELGNAISQTDDFYLCAAKRYFEFMTGINVQLGDFSKPPLSNVEPVSAKYRRFVIEQGTALRKHQSLKKLIENILRSRFYAESDYGVQSDNGARE